MATESPKVRAARNESLFREVNERIDSAGSGASPMFTEFMCECADDSCFDYISLTSEEYSSVRKMGAVFFVLKPGHAVPEVERVVGGEAHRYDIVEKFGVAAEVAVAARGRLLGETKLPFEPAVYLDTCEFSRSRWGSESCSLREWDRRRTSASRNRRLARRLLPRRSRVRSLRRG